MPHRSIAAQELGRLLGTLAHPDRLRLVEELRHGERDVSTLASALGLSQAQTSRHLALLRAHRLVSERREGRRVLYHLVQDGLAAWLAGGLIFLQQSPFVAEEVRASAILARRDWLDA